MEVYLTCIYVHCITWHTHFQTKLELHTVFHRRNFYSRFWLKFFHSGLPPNNVGLTQVVILQMVWYASESQFKLVFLTYAHFFSVQHFLTTPLPLSSSLPIFLPLLLIIALYFWIVIPSSLPLGQIRGLQAVQSIFHVFYPRILY